MRKQGARQPRHTLCCQFSSITPSVGFGDADWNSIKAGAGGYFQKVGYTRESQMILTRGLLPSLIREEALPVSIKHLYFEFVVYTS